MSSKPFGLILFLLSINTVATDTWPGFRGDQALGVVHEANLPTSWDLTSGKNILWKFAVDGISHSSPAVWKDSVFITSVQATDDGGLAIGAQGARVFVPNTEKHTWAIYSLSTKTGKVQWKSVAHEGAPRAKRHIKSSQCNATPATNGKYVVALFGSEGLFCYDMKGKLKWKKDLGLLTAGLHVDKDSHWGHSSSPIIYKDTVIQLIDHHEGSYIASFKLSTGEELWRTARDEMPTFGTPVVATVDGKDQLITNGVKQFRSYNPTNGELIWHMDSNVVVKTPTPVIVENKAIFAGGYPQGQPIYAVKLNATGNLGSHNDEGNNHLVWKSERGGPYTVTPVAYQGYLYSSSDNGIFTCYSLKDGSEVYKHRLGGGFSGSPVAANGHVYIASEEGTVHVIKAGPQFQSVSSIDMGEVIMSSPAIANNTLFIKTRGHVYALARK